jgi:hypothetical protein
MENKSSVFTYQNIEVDIKIKLAGLWTTLMFCYIYGDYFELYTPDKVNGLISGDNMLDTPVKLFIATCVMLVPSLMIFLSLMLRPTINRWLNIIFGIVYTTIGILIAFVSISDWYAFYVFLSLIEAIIVAIIIWLAVFWPKDYQKMD